MVEARLIYSVVLFIGILFALTTTATLETAALSGLINNTETENVTFITRGATATLLNPPVCNIEGNFLDQALATVGCVGETIGFLLGFASLGSDNIFFQIIFVAIIAMIVFIALNLLVKAYDAIVPL